MLQNAYILYCNCTRSKKILHTYTPWLLLVQMTGLPSFLLPHTVQQQKWSWGDCKCNGWTWLVQRGWHGTPKKKHTVNMVRVYKHFHAPETTARKAPTAEMQWYCRGSSINWLTRLEYSIYSTVPFIILTKCKGRIGRISAWLAVWTKALWQGP